MTHQIKYKAWDTDKKEMFDVEYISFNAVKKNGSWLHFIGSSFSDKRETDTCRLLQFTGLHDKNGKEIYEGDIMRSKNGGLWTVEFDYGSFGISLKGGHHMEGYGDWHSFSTITYQEKQCQIIGNIYEHGHLLEQ
jgi:uncharacterized phage protein (TIGR01671 family)